MNAAQISHEQRKKDPKAEYEHSLRSHARVYLQWCCTSQMRPLTDLRSFMPARVWPIWLIITGFVLLFQKPENLGWRMISNPVLIHSFILTTADNSSSPPELCQPGRQCYLKKRDFQIFIEDDDPTSPKTITKGGPAHAEFLQIKTPGLSSPNDQYCLHPPDYQWLTFLHHPKVLHSYTTSETPPQQAKTGEFFSCLPTRAIETYHTAQVSWGQATLWNIV